MLTKIDSTTAAFHKVEMRTQTSNPVLMEEKLLHVSGLNASPLQLTTEHRDVIGDTVYVVGNPEGLEGTFSQGIISSVRQLGLCVDDYETALAGWCLYHQY